MMCKIIKKSIALLMAVTMAFTPIAVSADELSNDPAELFEITTQAAAQHTAEFMEAFSIAGVTMAIVDLDSGFTWLNGFGYADAVNQIPVTGYTLFPIASVAKVFTAVAIMQLVEAGILDLDEPIVTYLPEFSILPNPVYGGDYRNITTRMLLAHVSGMHEFVGPGFAAMGGGQDRNSMNMLLPLLAEQHMQNVELNRITYNNTGYVILGILVAALTNSTNYFDGFVNYTQENIFDPAGMTSSSFAIGDHNRAYIALPHIDDTTLVEDFLYVHSTPSGGMVSNAYDMARFMQIMLNGGAFGDDEESRILQEETIQAMVQVQDFGIHFPTAMPTGMEMGLGIMHLSRPSGAITAGHGGNLQHHSDMILDLDNGIGVFVSVNSATGAGAAMPLAEAIWSTAVYEKTGEAVPLNAYFGTPIVPQDLQELVGWYSVVGELILDENGILNFVGFPGVPMPIELTLTEGGMFESMLGNVWFTEIEGVMFVFLGTAMLGERIEVSYATPAIERWIGEYNVYLDGEVVGTVSVGVNESDFPYANFGGGIFLMDKADEYTYVFLGRSRSLGSVARFSMDGDNAIFRYSGETFVRMAHAHTGETGPIIAPMVEVPEIELRFVIGSTEYMFNRATHQMDSAPFIDLIYNRTMIPLNVIAEVFGAEVNWIPETSIATITLDDVNLTLSADVSLPNNMGVVQNIDGRIFIPLAYVVYAFGANVQWDSANQAVYVLGGK